LWPRLSNLEVSVDNVAYQALVDLSETGLRFDVWNFFENCR